MEEIVFKNEPLFNKKTTLEIPGWEKLTILYSIDVFNGNSYLSWKVENTEQVFKILTTLVFEKHQLDFDEHFKLTLSTFREDYLEWEKEGFPDDWMKRYQRIFHKLIKK